jgi:hypothetical protein
MGAKKRGGYRSGSGRKSTWLQGPCKAVKLPVAIADTVVAYARRLDAGETDGGAIAQAPETPPPAEPQTPALPASILALVEEKQALSKTNAYLREELTRLRKKHEQALVREAELTRCITDAYSQVTEAIRLHDAKQRRGVTIFDARSIQLALKLGLPVTPESLPNQI